MKTSPVKLMAALLLMCLLMPSFAAAQPAEEAVVRAVLFYSPDCPHCHQVAAEVLAPMGEQYGAQLQVLAVNTHEPHGLSLYQAFVERYQVPPERRGVPTIVAGDAILVGGVEIPAQFPSLVTQSLSAGGTRWPDIPGLAEYLDQVPDQPSPTTPAPPAAECTPSASAVACGPAVAPAPTSSPWPTLAFQEPGQHETPVAGERFAARDPLGFGLAGVVLAGLVIGLGYSVWRIARPEGQESVFGLLRGDRAPRLPATTWSIPGLCTAGLGVASYLAYVEIRQVEAVCGPVGECNAVQSSDYTLFLGIPVAVWGIAFYLAVAALWAGNRYLEERLAGLSLLGLLGLTLLGSLFSIYLTCLELFVIRAICTWCLTSAVISGVLMLLVVIPATRERSAG
jgi:uncharacterized membrane protein